MMMGVRQAPVVPTVRSSSDGRSNKVARLDRAVSLCVVGLSEQGGRQHSPLFSHKLAQPNNGEMGFSCQAKCVPHYGSPYTAAMSHSRSVKRTVDSKVSKGGMYDVPWPSAIWINLAELVLQTMTLRFEGFIVVNFREQPVYTPIFRSFTLADPTFQSSGEL